MTSLGALAGVTIVTPNLDHSVAAYAAAFGYRPRQPESTVGHATASAWGCPEAAGCRMQHLCPESGESRFLRFVESATPAGYRPMSTFGWNAVELVVQDLDALHAKLLAQPTFEVIGPPKVLDFDFTDQISAMQVRGPSGEVLSAAHGLALDTRHRLTTVSLPERSLIEIDDFPVGGSGIETGIDPPALRAAIALAERLTGQKLGGRSALVENP